jgi:hypothetical protein
VDSYFHLANPEDAVKSYHVVPLEMDHGTPTVQVRIQGVLRILIVDSGSCCSILQPDISDYPLRCTNRALCGVTGDTLRVEGEQTLSCLLDNVSYRHTFLICKLPTSLFIYLVFCLTTGPYEQDPSILLSDWDLFIYVLGR